MKEFTYVIRRHNEFQFRDEKNEAQESASEKKPCYTHDVKIK